MASTRARTSIAAPRRAVVLAAGYGTRMLPLSRVLPKALVPVWGVPALEHVIRMLTAWGVRQILVNCHHRAEEIVRFVRSRPDSGVSLNLSFEPEILGTAGALRHAEWFLDDRPFWMLNADIAADLGPAMFLKTAARRNTISTLWLVPDRGPRSVETRGDRITTFRSQKSGAAGTFTFSGLHLVSPRILSYIPDGFSSIITAYEAAMRDGLVVRGITVPDSYWADLGTPEQVIGAHRDIAERYTTNRSGGSLMNPALLARRRKLRREGCRIDGFAAVDPSAIVHPRAKLSDAVVMKGARITGRGALRTGILAPGAVLCGPATRLVLRAAEALDEGEARMASRAVGPLDAMTAEALPHRGSARTFTRLRSGPASAVLIRYSTEREENALYAQHARFLRRARIPVPRVLADDPERGVTLFEDVGTLSLLHIAHRDSSQRTRRAYRKLLDRVHALHRRGTRALERDPIDMMKPFGPALYRWERELFQRYVLACPSRQTLEAAEQIMRDLARVSRRLARFEPVLLHRDLQSSNVYFPSGRPVLIDFQGMRLGPAAYDIASLLCDPYVSLSARQQDELLDYYSDKDDRAAGDMQAFSWAAIQRLAQALGAFDRLSRLPGGESFAEYVQPALRMMRRAVNNVDLPLPALADFVDRQVC